MTHAKEGVKRTSRQFCKDCSCHPPVASAYDFSDCSSRNAPWGTKCTALCPAGRTSNGRVQCMEGVWKTTTADASCFLGCNTTSEGRAKSCGLQLALLGQLTLCPYQDVVLSRIDGLLNMLEFISLLSACQLTMGVRDTLGSFYTALNVASLFGGAVLAAGRAGCQRFTKIEACVTEELKNDDLSWNEADLAVILAVMPVSRERDKQPLMSVPAEALSPRVRSVEVAVLPGSSETRLLRAREEAGVFGVCCEKDRNLRDHEILDDNVELAPFEEEGLVPHIVAARGM